jgi:ribosomal protein S7
MKIAQAPAVVRRRALSLAKQKTPNNDMHLFNIAVQSTVPQCTYTNYCNESYFNLHRSAVRYKTKLKSRTRRNPIGTRPMSTTAANKSTTSLTRRRIQSAMVLGEICDYPSSKLALGSDQVR